MLVFFIHGVSTKRSSYADILQGKIKKEISKRENRLQFEFYSSYWGNLFNNKKQQIVDFIERDFCQACEQHKEYKLFHYDVYRYREQRGKLINDFLGDFLVYQNPKRGRVIRQVILEQMSQFTKDHPAQREIHFIAHSLGSVILWDLLFSNAISEDDPAYCFRKQLENIDTISITTMGSPLLFLKQMLDLDFSTVDSSLSRTKQKQSIDSYKLRWVNIIHSSDLIAYPLQAAIKDEVGSSLLFLDQYVWQDANGAERTLRTLGNWDLAMVTAVEDAHSSYFRNNLDGDITARIITHNLLGETDQLLERCITPR